uniref:DUF4906 domain-containing protein n=1 Tax=Prevotella sp. GTC17260 TaxID=3236796 RepID=A0AB33JGV8_9BACT
MKQIRNIYLLLFLGIAALVTSCGADTPMVDGKETTDTESSMITVHVDLNGGYAEDKNTGNAKQSAPISRTISMSILSEAENFRPQFELYNEDATTEEGKKTDAKVKALCVFKRADPSTGKLQNNTELYGEITFKQKSKGSYDFSYKGKLELENPHGVTMNPGDQWYVMGIIGGRYNKDKHTFEVEGYKGFMRENGFVSTVVNPDRGTTIPFLSKWTKLTKVGTDNVVATTDNMTFNPQGILLRIRYNNKTKYNLLEKYIGIKSNVLADNIAYDLTSTGLPDIEGAEKDFAWNYTGELENKKWVNIDVTLATEYADAASQTPKFTRTLVPGATKLVRTDSNTKDENETVLIWTNVFSKPVDPEKPRVGFFTSSALIDEINENGSLNPQGQNLYVRTSSNFFDDFMNQDQYYAKVNNYRNSPANYKAGIKAAPGFDWVLTRVLDQDMAQYLGKSVKLTLSIPDREPLPIEEMAQNNLYQTYYGMPYFEPFPYDLTLPSWKESHYAAKDPSVLQNWLNERDKGIDCSVEGQKWIVPDADQWASMVFFAFNPSKNKSFNLDKESEAWQEGYKGYQDPCKEVIKYGDGRTKTYYSIYRRLPQTYPNNNYIYGLRFFNDANKDNASDDLCLVRYEWTNTNTWGGKAAPMFHIQAIHLGKLYTKLYGNGQDILDQIALADDDKNGKGMFFKKGKDIINRWLNITAPSQTYAYDHPSKNQNMGAGYVISDNGAFHNYNGTSFVTTGAANQYKAFVFRNNYVMTDDTQPGGHLNWYYPRSGAPKMYIRLMRKALKFEK